MARSATTSDPLTEPELMPRRRGGALAWGAALTFGVFALLAVVAIAWTWSMNTLSPGQQNQMMALTPHELTIFVLALTAPFAVLGTGLTWALVLLLRLGPIGRWPVWAQGTTAAAIVWIVGIAAAGAWLATNN